MYVTLAVWFAVQQGLSLFPVTNGVVWVPWALQTSKTIVPALEFFPSSQGCPYKHIVLLGELLENSWVLEELMYMKLWWQEIIIKNLLVPPDFQLKVSISKATGNYVVTMNV